MQPALLTTEGRVFIHITETNTNYFVNVDGKSLIQIYQEIVLRMNKVFIPPEEKRHIMSQISKQVKK